MVRYEVEETFVFLTLHSSRRRSRISTSSFANNRLYQLIEIMSNFYPFITRDKSCAQGRARPASLTCYREVISARNNFSIKLTTLVYGVVKAYIRSEDYQEFRKNRDDRHGTSENVDLSHLTLGTQRADRTEKSRDSRYRGRYQDNIVSL